jgi:small GTP-binding protein
VADAAFSELNQMDASEPVIKLLLIGESSVGKSCLLLRYAENKFQESFYTTIGIDFKIKHVTIDNQPARLQVWDTAGQEKFRTITKAYYRGAHGILLVFDMSNAETFAQCQTWMNSIHENMNEPVEIILVGNKCDKDRVVSSEEAQAFADRYKVRYFETSAKTGVNVEETFMAVAAMVVSNKSISMKGKENEMRLSGPKTQKTKGPCC